MQLTMGKRQVGPSSRCDFSKYLDTNYCSYLSPNEVKNFDIVNWWKSHESTFPVLSKMVHDLLAPPMSTVASKFVFSIVANIIGDKKTTLAIEMVEDLTCMKDWEDVCMRLQTLEDELKENLEKLDLNIDNDVNRLITIETEE